MSMSGIVRLGDLSSGHGCCFIPTALVSASPNVFINGRPCGRSGDHYATHGGGCEAEHEPDTDFLISINNVFVNGMCIAAQGDPTDKGSVAVGGSPNVFLVRR